MSPTRTRDAFWQVPGIVNGQVHFEDEVYQVRDGIAEAPLEIGEGAQWKRALPDQIAAYQAAVAGGYNPRELALAKVLEGTVAEVAAALAGPVEGEPVTGEELASLAALEQSGRNRKGVLEAIADAAEAAAKA